jgi:hypothetical protein
MNEQAGVGGYRSGDRVESNIRCAKVDWFALTKLKLGLVIHFGEQYVKNGIHRVVNGL